MQGSGVSLGADKLPEVVCSTVCMSHLWLFTCLFGYVFLLAIYCVHADLLVLRCILMTMRLSQPPDEMRMSLLNVGRWVAGPCAPFKRLALPAMLRCMLRFAAGLPV